VHPLGRLNPWLSKGHKIAVQLEIKNGADDEATTLPIKPMSHEQLAATSIPVLF